MVQKRNREELEERILQLEKEALVRDQAYQDLRQGDERRLMIFNRCPLGIIYFDHDGLVMDCNERFLDIVGVPREKLIGFYMAESLRDARMRSAVATALSGKTGYYEGDYQSLAGKRVTSVRAVYVPISSEEGRLLAVAGFFEDIGAQKQAEEALRKSKEYLDKIINCISDPIFVKDRQHRLVLVNDAECALAGREREAILGRTDYDFFPHEQVDVFWEKDEVVFETGEENENEEQIMDARGVLRTIVTKKTLYTDNDGNKFIVGVIRDITDRKETERALQTAHQELQDIIEFLPDATFIIDRDKRVVYWNRAMEEMTGIEKRNILGKGDYSVPFYGERKQMLIDFVADRSQDVEKRYSSVKWIGKTVYGDAYVPGAYQGGGAFLWSTAAPLLGRDGSVVGYIQSIRDISDRKQAEEALRQSEEKYRQLFETVSDAILVFDAQTRRFIDVNERALRLYGYSRDQFLTLRQGDITAEPELSEASIKETLCGIQTRVPLRYHRKKDGTVFPAEISSSTFVLAGRRVLCGIVRDITERKRVEEELAGYRDRLEDLVEERTAELAKANERLRLEIEERRRAEEALRMFAYSVAHDLKSPVIGIYGLTKRLHKISRELLDEKGRLYCDQILKVSEHMAALVEKINVYIVTKSARPSFEQIHLRDILWMIRDEFSAQLSIRRIEWIEPETEVEIKADRLALIRVFRNLIDNALKYGGEPLSKIWIGHREEADFHVFSVTDDGRGLKGADSEKVFDLFQRQESSRGVDGAGLGLTIVKEIAEQHGGKVWVGPGAGKGTAFYISISKKL